MASMLEPVVAAVTAVVISATSPATLAAHPTSCASSNVVITAAEANQIADEIRGATTRLALDAPRDMLSELLPVIERLRHLCLATTDLVVQQPPDEEDRGADDERDEPDSDDLPDPAPRPAPTPTPTPMPMPAPMPPTRPGPPGPGSLAAELEQVLRDLATALQASSDPAMRQLGADLAAMLDGGTSTVPAPLPTPGAPSVPVPPGTLPSVLPSGATELFADDFEGGDLSKWGTCQGAGVNGDCAGLTVEDGMGVGQDPQRGNVAQFRVVDGEEAEMGGERSEVRDDNNAGTLVGEGDDRWFSWSMKFAGDFPEPSGIWFIVTQWHQGADSGSPPLTLDISQGTLDISGDGTDAPRQTIGPIRRGEWVDYVLHVRFSQNDGFVEAWENGVQTVERTARPTLFDGSDHYLKMGIYRDPDATGAAEVWFDDYRIFDGAGGSAPMPGAHPPVRPGDDDESDDGSTADDGPVDRTDSPVTPALSVPVTP